MVVRMDAFFSSRHLPLPADIAPHQLYCCRTRAAAWFPEFVKGTQPVEIQTPSNPAEISGPPIRPRLLCNLACRATTMIKWPAMLCTMLSSLAACQLGPSQALSLKSNDDATQIMVAIATAAQTCWFKSRDIAFSGYRLANEVNSPAGRPRVLLVPKRDPSALPLLVIQAERRGDTASGTYTDIQTFGPILSSSHGKRITDDVKRWSNGNRDCK